MKAIHTIQLAAALSGSILALSPGAVRASTYGTLNNFDTVNTTGEECHGFEIELEDCHSADVTRTYNYNHYGVPRIIEDASVPEHVRCLVRWESTKDASGAWQAYTAIPDGPIRPTNGHMFTNPAVNFGGEHFGVSYRGAPTAVHYFWLVDRGGELVRGPAVQVATPTFTYAAGQVRAVLEPPEPPERRVDQFGKPTWVKAIKTTAHNNHEVQLRDLVSDDPDDEHDVNWRNGEPNEVETEWHLLQEEFDEDGVGEGGELEGEPEDLEAGDEVVTRRWEFYAYTGPLDPENGEALADSVAEDGLHGVGITTAAGQEFNLGEMVVVGDYLGAQMSAFDIDPEVELVDHLQDGEVNEAYPERAVVSAGLAPFTATCSGELPDGMTFNDVTGILSGTPTLAGEFSFTIVALDAETPPVSRDYTLRIAAAGAALVPVALIETAAVPAEGGVVAGGGSYEDGLSATVVATPEAGYKFVNWTEQGRVVSTARSYEFTADVNRTLVARFALAGPELSLSLAAGGDFVIEWPMNPPGWTLQESPDLSPASWLDSTRPVAEEGGVRRVTVTPDPAGYWFFRLSLP